MVRQHAHTLEALCASLSLGQAVLRPNYGSSYGHRRPFYLSDESSAVRIARSAPQISEMVTLNEIAIEIQSENSSETV